MSQLAHDVVDLAELQTSLIQIELHGWWKKLLMPAAILVASLVIGLSCMPILILSAAYALQLSTSWSLALCLCIAGLGAAVLAVIVGLVGWSKLKAAQSPLSESRKEFSRNIRWIKSVLQHRAGPTQALRTSNPIKPGGTNERNIH